MFAIQYAFQFLKKIQKLNFWIFFLGGFFCCGIVLSRLKVVVGRSGF